MPREHLGAGIPSGEIGCVCMKAGIEGEWGGLFVNESMEDYEGLKLDIK